MDSFWIECEKLLYEIIVGVFERNEIKNRFLSNKDVVLEDLYFIKNTELHDMIKTYKNFPPTVQAVVKHGLVNRLREYYKNS